MLNLLPIGPNLYLNTLVLQLNVSSTVDRLKYDWLHYFHVNWINMAHVEILSYHNSAGTIIAKASTPGTFLVFRALDRVANAPLSQVKSQLLSDDEEGPG